MKYAGVEFLKSVPEATYDAIILDAFQEMGISLSLTSCVQFTYWGWNYILQFLLTSKLCSGPSAQELADKHILESVARALRPGGVLSTQAESMWNKNFILEDIIADCRKIFKGSVNYAWTTVPVYSRYAPLGSFGFLGLFFMGFSYEITLVNFICKCHFQWGSWIHSLRHRGATGWLQAPDKPNRCSAESWCGKRAP